MRAIGFRLPATDWFRLDTFGFISRNCITIISGLRPLPPPLWCLRHHLPPAVRWDNKAPLNIFFIRSSKYSTGCCAPACGGKVVAPATKGGRRRQAAYKMALQGAHLPSGAILYNSRGRSPQTVRKAKPIPDTTLGAQGRKPRRRHQPSRQSRVNLREYSKHRHLSPRPITSNIAHSKKALTISH